MFEPVPYSQERLNRERGTECPDCGPTTWIAGVAGYSCCACGQDLEELLPPLCIACRGRGTLTRGGWVAGACPHCRGKGTRGRPPLLRLEDMPQEARDAIRESARRFQKRSRKGRA